MTATYRVFTRHGWLASSAPSPDKTILTPMALILRDMRNMGVLARIVVVSYVSIIRTTCASRHMRRIHSNLQQTQESAVTKGTVSTPASTDILSRFNKTPKIIRARQHKRKCYFTAQPPPTTFQDGGTRRMKDEGGGVADSVQCQR